MKGLLTKDFLTIKKKYGLPRVIMDIAIIIQCVVKPLASAMGI